ncbi:hypothetical protein RI129_006621 [Pyrocoelia pectoralis]|uniref:THAP-type domain-containing protein n=1 Tax=Pyrocoelia pectoralis TaxID=417401 RepID=A0AAN7ZPS4_9COLE
MTSYTGVSAKLVFTNDCLAIMKPSKRCYKWCFVPMCTNTTFTTPEKTFLTMPRDVKIRKMWFKAARRDYSKITSSDFYCCEDHFDNEQLRLSQWLKRFAKHSLGTIVYICKKILESVVCPYRFSCNAVSSETIKVIEMRISPIDCIRPKDENADITFFLNSAIVLYFFLEKSVNTREIWYNVARKARRSKSTYFCTKQNEIEKCMIINGNP